MKDRSRSGSMFQKICAVVCSIVLVVGMMPSAAWAGNDTDQLTEKARTQELLGQLDELLSGMDEAPASDVESTRQTLQVATANLRDRGVEFTVDEVADLIKALSVDPCAYTADDRAQVEAVQAAFESLSAEDQATVDNMTGHPGTAQPLGRVLEAALWAVWSYDKIDNSTTLENGDYDATTTPALSSIYSKGKSTSPRQKPWSVKSVHVENGLATATIMVESETYSDIWKGGEYYPRTNTSGYCEFEGVPIDLNSTFYFAGVSTSMGTPIVFSLTTTIEEPEGEDTPQTIDLDIVNGAGMVKPVSAYLYVDVDGSTSLVLALSGTGFKQVFSGMYDEAVENGDNRDAWTAGVTDESGAVEFTIPLVEGQTEVPIVAILQSALDKYDAGTGALAAAFYPRTFTIDYDACTLTAGEESQIEEGRIDLVVTNATREATVTEAYLDTDAQGTTSLVFTVSDIDANGLLLGSLQEALASSLSNSAWIAGTVQSDGQVHFSVPYEFGTDHIVMVLADCSAASAAETVHPFELFVDASGATLAIEPYDETVDVSISVADTVLPTLSIANAATLRIIGGPNDSSFKCALTMKSQDKLHDYIEYQSLVNGAIADAGVEIAAGQQFDMVLENKGSLKSFALGQPVELHVRHVESQLWLERTLTLDIAESTVSIGGIDARKDIAYALIDALPRDPFFIRSDSDGKIAAAEKAFNELPENLRDELDNELTASDRTRVGRVLENALWALDAMKRVDNSTKLPEGIYTTGITSSSNMGKSISSRGKGFTVKQVKVKGGFATAVLEHGSSTAGIVLVNGKEYKSINDTGNRQYEIPIDLNSTFHIVWKAENATAATVGFSFEITNAIDETRTTPDEDLDSDGSKEDESGKEDEKTPSDTEQLIEAMTQLIDSYEKLIAAYEKKMAEDESGQDQKDDSEYAARVKELNDVLEALIKLLAAQNAAGKQPSGGSSSPATPTSGSSGYAGQSASSAANSAALEAAAASRTTAQASTTNSSAAAASKTDPTAQVSSRTTTAGTGTVTGADDVVSTPSISERVQLPEEGEIALACVLAAVTALAALAFAISFTRREDR